jgi:glycosyltransferase involved in cell wall biosynthesis
MAELSVVIPTRDRLESLRLTLASLAAAEGIGRLDAIIVDDGSEEPLAPHLSEFAEALELTVHRQEPAGLNIARTAGIERTSGGVVAFLDDDVLVDRRWPDGMLAAFADGELAVAAGRTIADPEVPIPGWVSPEKLLYVSVLDLGEEPGPLPAFATPVGANLGIRREWLERAGGFRPGLDRSGRSLISGGDTDLVRRIEAAGGRIAYWPAATVRHRIAAERLTKTWFRRRALAQGVSDARILYAGERPAATVLAREAVRPLRSLGIAAKRLAAWRDPIDAELWLWSSRGRWRELRRSMRGTSA